MAPRGAPPGAFLLLAAVFWGGVSAVAPPAGERLLGALLARYRTEVRPGGGPGGGPVLVHLGLELAQLVSLDEKNEELVTKVYLNLSWQDPRLRWDPRAQGGLRALRVGAERIWLPDVGLENNNDGEFGVSLGVRAVVTWEGSVRWRPPALYRSRCPIRVSHFPFDWQNCSLVFRSASYEPEELLLVPLGGGAGGDPQVALAKDYQGNGQWELWHRSGRAQPGPCPRDLSFFLVLRRKPLFYLANVLVPCVLVPMLALGVFYLPPEAGEKMSLALFALLTLTVFLLLLADKVPATSLAVPLIGRYLTGTLVLLTLCVLLSVGVLNLHHRSAATHSLPGWAQRLFLQRLPPLLGLRPPPAAPSPPAPSCAPLRAPSRGGDEYFLRRPPYAPSPGPRAPSSPPRAWGPPGPPPPPELREAAAAVGVIARGLREQRRRQEEQQGWQLVALAVDRLFLGTFLLLTGGCVLGTGLDAALHRPPPDPFP